MNRRIVLASALAALFASVCAADFADAKTAVVRFKGTRDQVRSACKAQNGELVEGKDHTWCGGQNGRGVICYDDGNCYGGRRKPTMADEVKIDRGPAWQPAQSYQAQPGSWQQFGTYQAP